MSAKADVFTRNEQKVEAVTPSLRALVRRAIKAALEYEKVGFAPEVSVTFTDNAGIHELNKKFREIDRPTDVLSFPLFDFDGEYEEPPVDEMMNMLGDIVISLEKAEEQANEFGHSVKREVGYLTIHSMLHLLGYDHLDEGPMKAQMRNREETIAAGIPGMSR